MELVDHNSEMGIINLMMNGFQDDVLDMVDLKLFSSREGKEAFRKIGGLSFGKKVTSRMLKQEYADIEVMTDYIDACERMNGVSLHELPAMVEKIHEIYTRKVSIEYANEIIEKSDGDIAELRSLVGSGLDVDDMDSSELYQDATEGAKEYFKQFLEDFENPESRGRIKIKSMDQLSKSVNGLDRKNGDFILMCAQSGKGKTAFALTIAKDICIDQGLTGLYMNCEMNPDQLRDRLIAMMKDIDVSELDARIFTGSKEVQMDKLCRVGEGVDEMAKSKLFFSQTSSISPRLIRRAFKKLTLSGKTPDIIFIDYIAYMDLEKPMTGKQEHQVLLEYAIACKQLATDLKVPIIALAQLNADGKLEGAKKMINPCDAVFFIQELKRNTDDVLDDKEKKKAEAEIKRELNSMTDVQMRKANYKITKEKVRRGDPTKPIYIRFEKSQMKVMEIE